MCVCVCGDSSGALEGGVGRFEMSEWTTQSGLCGDWLTSSIARRIAANRCMPERSSANGGDELPVL